MHIALPKPRSGDKSSPSEQRLGFLAAKHQPTLGYVGGYLLTTARGRPLEFHYTNPIRPSPTHRILYGSELEPYILGELIGSNLIKQPTLEVAFIITDQPQVLDQRRCTSCPMLCVEPSGETPGAQEGPGRQAAQLRCHSGYPDDVAALNHWLQEVNPSLDLAEPFVRVWDALREVLSSEPKSHAA